MGLSGQQRKKLATALIDAFPTTASLEQMLAFELDKSLRAIAGEGSLQEIVFKLIQTADSQGWVEDLVRAARKSNPGNPQLKAIAEKVLLNHAPETPPSIPQKQSVQSQYKTNDQSQFDVFLAHNSQDKPQVRKIAQELKRRGLESWLDEEQIPPGRPFQDEIEKAIPLVKSAAIFLGLQGLGKWQRMELRALISECVNKNIPVIPVLLPGVDKIPDHLSFLKEFNWVTFAQQIDDKNALNLLEWGITGQKPIQLLDSTEKPGRVPTSDDLSSNVQTISKTMTRLEKVILLRDNFLLCHSILNPSKRNKIILSLRPQITGNSTLEGDNNTVMQSVIETSLNYQGGLLELLETTEKLFERDSIQMKKIWESAQKFFPEEVANRKCC